MNGKVRFTTVVWDILDVLSNASPDDPPWGLRLCEQTGHGPGTVYPALDRLLNAGVVTDRWEDPEPKDRPKRRFYEVTAAGRQWLAEAVQARDQRRMKWLRQAPQNEASL